MPTTDNKTIKSAILEGIHLINIIEKEKPRILNAKDVLLKIKAVGICGSDIHYYNEGNIGDQIVDYPFVVGHESAAVVEEIGHEVTKVKPGDKIAIEPTIWCGHCEQCINNRKHTCLNQKFLGCPGQIEGVLKEYAVLPEENCFVIKQDLSFDLAVFAEPLSIGIYAVKLSDLDIKNANVAILGAGPIGQSVLACCIKKGCTNISVTDKLDYRLKIAKKMGATWAGNASKLETTDELREKQSFDIVFECCGKQEAINQAVEILKPGGKLMMVGIPGTENISLSIHNMRRKEICFQNVRRQNGCFQEAINMIDKNRDYFQPLITHHFNLKDVKKGFDLVLNYQGNVMKAIVHL